MLGGENVKKLLGILLLVFVITTGFSGVVSAADGHNKSIKKHYKYTDRHFIENMVPHHKEAVQMSNIALKRGEHREIKQLARNIKRSQSREIKEMSQWYRKWYGRNIPTSSMIVHRMAMMNPVDLNKLRTAEPFDKEFIKQMVPHHKMGIMMVQIALKNLKHPQIRKLANSIVKTQSAEIKEMGQWYKRWYGTNLPASSGMMESKMMNG